MVVYFTASVALKHKYVENYRHIIDVLHAQKHEVIADHIIDETEDHIRLLTRDERLKFHEKVENWIHSCDFIIAETSAPSTSMGYEIALGLRVGKPVLILYSEGDAPSLLGQHKDERLVAEKYSKENLGQIIKDFSEYVEGKTDLRFTFFITPRIVSYLDKVAKEEKMPKSVYIRKLIEEDMKNRA